MGDESIMSPKANGSTEKPPQKNLRYGVDWVQANTVCCFNRHYAEYSGYFLRTKWHSEVDKEKATDYFDSVTGNRLFTAPIGRSVYLFFFLYFFSLMNF